MSTLDQRLGAQAGKSIAYANEAALAIAREVTRQQRQIVQELRTPVLVETPADRLARKRQEADAARQSADAEPGADRAAVAGGAAGDPLPADRLSGDGPGGAPSGRGPVEGGPVQGGAGGILPHRVDVRI